MSAVGGTHLTQSFTAVVVSVSESGALVNCLDTWARADLMGVPVRVSTTALVSPGDIVTVKVRRNSKRRENAITPSERLAFKVGDDGELLNGLGW